MSVVTERGQVHTAGPLDKAKHKLGKAKEGVKREALTHATRVAMSDNIVDFSRMQVDDARELNDQRWSDDGGRLAKFGQNVDLVGLAIALVVVGVVMYVGLNVMSTTESSTELDNDSEFSNASSDLTSGIADSYSLSGILFLVLILTGVVGLLLGLRGRR